MEWLTKYLSFLGIFKTTYPGLYLFSKAFLTRPYQACTCFLRHFQDDLTRLELVFLGIFKMTYSGMYLFSRAVSAKKNVRRLWRVGKLNGQRFAEGLNYLIAFQKYALLLIIFSERYWNRCLAVSYSKFWTSCSSSSSDLVISVASVTAALAVEDILFIAAAKAKAAAQQ